MSRSVLVVDDDACFRDLVGRVLDGSGYAVVAQAGGVRDALALAVACRPDTALVDVGLPDGNGYALATSLSAMPWPLQVVVISSDADCTSAPAAHGAGACGFLRKDQLSASAFRHLVEGP